MKNGESDGMEGASARARAEELVESVDLALRDNVRDVLNDLLDWSARRSSLITFDRERRESPDVTFKLNGGDVFWAARGTVGKDAKIELLTRTFESRLPPAVLRQFRQFLADLPNELKPGGTVLVPMQRLRSPEARLALREAMDFSLGAVAAMDARTA